MVSPVASAQEGVGAAMVKEWQKAGEQGDLEAQYELDVMYAKGEGVVQDYVATHMWWVQARAQGHEGATGNLDFLIR